MPEGNVKNIRKILILRFSSLGDIVMATPMIRCLRNQFPNAQIDMVVRGDFLELIEENPHLDRKIGLDRNSGMSGLLKLHKEMKREHYDLVYDAHRSLRTRFLMPVTPAENKAYFEKPYVQRALTFGFKLPLLKDVPRMMNKYIEPLEPYGVRWDGKGPELFVSEKIQERAKQIEVPEGPLVAFIPSAQWPGKRWPEDKFRELLGLFLEQTDYGVLVFGGNSDHFCETIVKDYPTNRVLNLQGKLNIAEAAAMLKQVQFTVANDTGLMHLADALNIPSVLVLGPTAKEMGCLPFHELSQIVEHELWCRPCSKNGQAPCIRKKRWCLELTTSQSVFDRALGLSKALGAV